MISAGYLIFESPKGCAIDEIEFHNQRVDGPFESKEDAENAIKKCGMNRGAVKIREIFINDESGFKHALEDFTEVIPPYSGEMLLSQPMGFSSGCWNYMTPEQRYPYRPNQFDENKEWHELTNKEKSKFESPEQTSDRHYYEEFPEMKPPNRVVLKYMKEGNMTINIRTEKEYEILLKNFAKQKGDIV